MVSIRGDPASDGGSRLSLVKARDLSPVTSRLQPVSAHTMGITEKLLLCVISIASGQATTDLHPDTRDGPDFADPELLLNDKTSDHLKKSSLGTNFTP